MSSLREDLLPAETWTQVVSYLAYPDQISLLSVSRMFHAITIRFVFACVKVYFVAGTFTEVFASYPYFVADMGNITDRLLRRSWEKLERIIDNPGFANSVKILSVVAAAANSPSVFEQLTLAKALRAMRNLRVFYWFGIQPELPSEVIDCLSTQLRSLHIQSAPVLSPTSSHHLRSMQLQDLQVETLFHISPRMHSIEPDIQFWIDMLVLPSNTITVFESLWSPQLRRLNLLSKDVNGIPMLRLGLLKELEICVPGGESGLEISGLDLVFHHTPMLESLSVVGFVTAEIFFLLPQDPAILPKLTSFRLSAETWTLSGLTDNQLFPLSQFLEQKLSLRRLSLRLGSAVWDIISILVPTIRQLRHIEVFGLHAGGQPMIARDFMTLASVLTPGMSSIQLVIPWDYPDTFNVNVTILAPLLQCLRELPHLKFIHMYSLGRILPIVPDDIAADLVHLHTLGWDRSIWDVRDGFLHPWDPWRVRYALDEDFDSLDDAWLFKHL